MPRSSSNKAIKQRAQAMSGISPIPSTPLQSLQVDPVVQTQGTQQAQEQTTTQLPPAYEALPFQRLSLATMGLSNPGNAEDFAALLADVEDKLDKTDIKLIFGDLPQVG